MRGVHRALLLLAATALLAAALSACGGGDSTDSSTATATTTAPSTSGGASAENGGQGTKPAGGGAGKSGSGSGAGSADPSEKGSAGFIVPGGDNSIQNFGEEADSGEREAAEEVLAAYFGARAAGDWSKACTYLSAAVKAQLDSLGTQASQLKGKGCGATLGALSGGIPAAERANTMTHGLASLRAKGETGFGLYHGADGVDYTIVLAYEDGAWKVGGLAPTEIQRGPGG